MLVRSLLGIALAWLTALGPLTAHEYPQRLVTLVAPWPPGGIVDNLCRLLAAKLTEELGKPVIVDNRPGAGSVIGTAVAARAPPDGYTLLMAGSTALAVNPSVHKNLPYDPQNDFVPIALVAQIPFVLVVTPSVPAYSVADLISLVRQRPKQLSYGSFGPGSPAHLFMEMFKAQAQLELLHVPYRAMSAALNDVIGGHVPIMFVDPSAALPLVQGGKLRALAVTSHSRFPSAPDIPTLSEAALPGFEAVGWSMLVAPAKTPAAITERLHAAMARILASPDVQEAILKFGVVPTTSLPIDALQSYLRSEITRWEKIVRDAGLFSTE
jgi:tripartite-type tricarboxylate transporter receptor subunit TctC